MPGWHAKTTELVAAGKLTVVGISEEQHRERTQLFMQWQKMDWPVLMDPLNLLELKGIPYTLLLDAGGVIRYRNPSADDLETFIATSYEQDGKTAPAGGWDAATLKAIEAVGTNSADLLDGAITAMEAHCQAKADDAQAHFRHGVLLRRRYDQGHRRPTDFQSAIAAWAQALELDGSQYIWRRRIQQYGPRLDKPYPFYNWVAEARAEIEKAGETPVGFVAELSGAETAQPEKKGKADAPSEIKHPDPKGKVPADGLPLIHVQSVLVPSTDQKKVAYRVHIEMTPNAGNLAHWNNESEPVAFFLDSEKGWQSPTPVVQVRQPSGAPASATSLETRTLELEIRPESEGKIPKTVSGVLYYYVCEGATGTCQFLQRAVTVALKND